MNPALSEMPEDWNALGSSPGSSPPRRRSAATIGLGVPMYCAAPASARNSRCRENQTTMIEARMPKTISQTTTVT